MLNNPGICMANPMIRVNEELLDDLKLLKKVKGVASYQEVIKGLVHQELKQNYAYTKEGYVAVGTVVASDDGKPLVIKEIREDKVVFNDNTYVINGGGACYSLNYLADCIGDYHGDRINE